MMLSISIITTVIISCIHIVKKANDNGRYDFAIIVRGLGLAELWRITLNTRS